MKTIRRKGLFSGGANSAAARAAKNTTKCVPVAHPKCDNSKAALEKRAAGNFSFPTGQLKIDVQCVIWLQTEYPRIPHIGRQVVWPKGPGKAEKHKKGYAAEEFQEIASNCREQIDKVRALHSLYDEAIKDGKGIEVEEWTIPNMMHYLRAKLTISNQKSTTTLLKDILRGNVNAKNFVEAGGYSIETLINNHTRLLRKLLLNRIRKLSTTVTAVCVRFDSALEECLLRNQNPSRISQGLSVPANLIREVADGFEDIIAGEGFDQLIFARIVYET